MKNSRLEKIPAPISLSKRGNQIPVDSATPYRMEWGTPLQAVDSNNNKPHKSTISTMKEELSNIKTDVEKLLNEDCPETRRNTPSELISKSVRAELDYHKEVQEKLRMEIRELKLRLSEEKSLRQEKQALERRIDQLRTEWKGEKAKLKKHSEEATLKHSQEVARWKSDYETLLQKTNVLNKEHADLEQTYSQEKGRLLKTVSLLEKEISERRDEYQTALKQRQSKYESALGEFKKLEVKFDRNTQESVLTLMHKNISLEQQLSNACIGLEDFKRRLNQQTHRYERALHYQEQLKARSAEMEDRLRAANRQNQLQQELNNAIGKLQASEASKGQLYTTYLEKCREYEELMEEFQSRNKEPNYELQRMRMENTELVKMSELVNQQLKLARGRISYLDAIMLEKDSYIEAMEDLQQSEATSQAMKELQDKCMQMLQEKNELVRNYENAIRQLENSMSESRERSMSQSMMFASVNGGSRRATFDEALKEQIQENEQLRNINKQKSQEIYELRGEVDELKRNLDTQRTERQLEKMRSMAVDKNMKNTYEITIQDLRNEIESLKRKLEVLQRKVDQKTDDIRRKDDFIKTSIIGRMGKQESQTDVQYLARELEKFINVTALDHIRM